MVSTPGQQGVVLQDCDHEFRNHLFATVLRSPQYWRVSINPDTIMLQECFNSMSYQISRKHFDSIVFEAAYNGRV